MREIDVEFGLAVTQIRFRTRRGEWYRKIRRQVSKLRAFEWFFLLFRKRYVTCHSDLVIEGYPRTGNTFACAAFIFAQPKEPAIADHFHSIGHVRRALRLNVPVMILIREPLDAVSSFLVYQKGDYSVELAFKEYIEFYDEIFKCRDRVVVAEFGQIIHWFGAVISAVNERFKTSFSLFDDTDESRDKCFGAVESRQAFRMTSEDDRRFKSSRPVRDRESLINAVRAELLKPPYAILLKQAQTVYERLTK